MPKEKKIFLKDFNSNKIFINSSDLLMNGDDSDHQCCSYLL